MKQTFIPYFYSLTLQPCTRLFLLGLIFFFASVLFTSSALYLLSIAAIFVASLWFYKARRPIGENFVALRSMPIIDGKPYYFICQQAQKGAKDKRCRTLQYSLLRDKAALEQLPSGNYKTITHDGVLNILKSSNRIQLVSVISAYKADLRHILRMQSGKRCRHCKSRCKAWNSPPRQFYVVEFAVP